MKNKGTDVTHVKHVLQNIAGSKLNKQKSEFLLNVNSF